MRPFTWRSLARLLVVSVLCCGVMLQILGVTVTFWDLNGSSDLVASSLLEGFAVLPGDPVLSPILPSWVTAIVEEDAHRDLREQMVFHPPLSSR